MLGDKRHDVISTSTYRGEKTWMRPRGCTSELVVIIRSAFLVKVLLPARWKCCGDEVLLMCRKDDISPWRTNEFCYQKDRNKQNNPTNHCRYLRNAEVAAEVEWQKSLWWWK